MVGRFAWVDSDGGVPEQLRDAYADMRRAGVVLQAAVASKPLVLQQSCASES